MSVVSMTGFGRARGELSARMSVSVVTRSVNHRYLDVSVRTSLKEELPEAEAVVRRAVTGRCERGRVTVQLTFERTAPADTQVLVEREAVASVIDQLRSMELGDDAAPSVGVRDVLAVPGLVLVSAGETLLDDNELSRLEDLASDAVGCLVEMRVSEGERLERQVKGELRQLVSFLDWFEPQTDEFRTRVLERLRDRMVEVLGEGATVDPDRLAQEAALAADRADVAEEVVRLRSHVDQFEQRLQRGGTVGRSLDFLCQEMNRELNTLGSKCRELGVAERLVDAKTAAERVREQVQNLE